MPKSRAPFPALHEFVEATSTNPYASKGDVVLLAIVSKLQPWMRGPWMEEAVADVRERVENSWASLNEIDCLDETTGEVLFTIPSPDQTTPQMRRVSISAVPTRTFPASTA